MPFESRIKGHHLSGVHLVYSVQMDHARQMTSAECGEAMEAEIYASAGNNLEEYIQTALQTRFASTTSNGALCKFCHKKSATIALMQTRSADEGMTAHATCHNPRCGRKWTVH